jgi:murein DD-endopeptidase MepM/ murein hydrolase activator NlpD
MKKLLLYACCLSLLFTNAAAQSPDYDRISSRLVACYNKAQYDSIWQLFSKEMQGNLPATKTDEFFSGVMNYYGKIKQAKYDHQKSASVTYKLTFDEGMMALNFLLDNKQKITDLTITPFAPAELVELERNTTKLILPFEGEWTVFWGGDTREQNHHVVIPAQKNAFDIMICNEQGKTYKTDGKTNEDYYAFEQPLVAPCNAEVVWVVDGVKDNKPGDLNPIFVPGNSLMLKTQNNEYMLFAHFKNHSVKVKEGDRVKQGQLLGLCGNSGNSSEPHLHFHIENVEDMNTATGAKCYFDKILVNAVAKNDYSPVKGDKVRNNK